MRVVFAHFGKKIPRHLTLNLIRTSKLFPELPVVLLPNTECKMPKISGIEVCRIESDRRWFSLEAKLTHSQSFRDNFWFTSLARFLALEAYSKSVADEIIHVESDVILSKDFPFNSFSNVKSIAYPLVSQEHGIASVLYLKNAAAANLLVQESITSAENNSKTTDMLVLKELYDHHKEIIQLLPTAPANPNYYRFHIPPEILQNMAEGVAVFGGCFDGSDIGSYLAGNDPRNRRGFRTLRVEISANFLLVRNLGLVFAPYRNFLDFKSAENSNKTPLFSLHIHSKDLRWFKISISERLFLTRVRDFLKSPGSEFIVRVFVMSTYKAILRRLFLPFVGDNRA